MLSKQEISEELYKNMSVSSLIIFGIYSNGRGCTYSELVKECFLLFPKTFSFQGNSAWPDSLKFDRPLRFLKRKKLVSKNSEGVFGLTKQGRKIAERVEMVFHQSALNI